MNREARLIAVPDDGNLPLPGSEYVITADGPPPPGYLIYLDYLDARLPVSIWRTQTNRIAKGGAVIMGSSERTAMWTAHFWCDSVRNPPYSLEVSRNDWARFRADVILYGRGLIDGQIMRVLPPAQVRSTRTRAVKRKAEAELREADVRSRL